jgi:tRNA (guanine37-N1)-methyltransferase
LIFEILTLFPRMVDGPLRESVLGKAREAGLIEVRVRDIREHATGRHRVCDDAPYGGGPGMVMKPEPLAAALEAARAGMPPGSATRAVLLSPAGRVFSQAVAQEYARLEGLVLVCGRYEGVDERVVEAGLLDEELSLGDFVLTGGEFAALAVVDAVARLQPGVLGNETSSADESFAEALLEYPQYTRPPEFRGLRVPEVLVGGHHAQVKRWRRKQQLLRTRDRRPDLWARHAATAPAEDEKLLKEQEE